MTKQEKIQEAYRECFEEMKPWIDEDGWFNKNAFYQKKFNFNYEQIDILFSHHQDFMIPKSIFRLKDNNGWKKIETKKDLPNDDEWYWVKKKTGEQIMSGYQRLVSNERWLNEITHYQKIVKPQEPLY